MMRLKGFFMAAIIVSFLGSCGEKSKEVPIENQPPTPIKTETTEILVEKIIAKRNQVIEQLKTLDPEGANRLYETYKKENDSLIFEIEDLELNTLIAYVSFYDEDGRDLVLPDSVKLKEKLLNKADLQFWEIGEGMTAIKAKHDFYLKIFKNYVTPDYRDFISINADEDKHLYAADAGLSISIHDLGKRVLTWENFIAQHQGSKLMPQAKETYEYYQWDYLFGLDNTPSMERATAEIYQENKTEFKQFIKENPKSYTSYLAQIVLDNKGSYENLVAKIKDERAGYIY
jgi:hypothetical protein